MSVIARMNFGGPALQVSTLMRGLDPELFDQQLYAGNNEGMLVSLIEVGMAGVPPTGLDPMPLR